MCLPKLLSYHNLKNDNLTELSTASKCPDDYLTSNNYLIYK